MDDYKYQLWEYLADELNAIALDGQIEEIIRLSLRAVKTDYESTKDSWMDNYYHNDDPGATEYPEET